MLYNPEKFQIVRYDEGTWVVFPPTKMGLEKLYKFSQWEMCMKFVSILSTWDF